MKAQNHTAHQVVASAVDAIANLLESRFEEIASHSQHEAICAHSEIEQMEVNQKGGTFFRYFLPFRKEMVTLLAETYRRCFRLALAHPTVTADDPNVWGWAQLHLAIPAVVEWIHDWYILACDGENRNVRRVAKVDCTPGQTISVPIPTADSAFPPLKSWRAPAWLFGVSLPIFGIGLLKQQHIPNMDSTDRLGAAHTRLLLTGARRMFSWDLRAAIGRVRNEETAAAGTIPVAAVNEKIRGPNNRKGWQQREKLFGFIQKVLTANPALQGIEFCAELDKRHAPPLFDWTKSGEWREGLTWKEAWRIPDLRRKIRRVRQDAQKAS